MYSKMRHLCWSSVVSVLLGNCTLDLVFVIDNSGFSGVNSQYWSTLKTGLVAFVTRIDQQVATISQSGTHVATILYSEQATTAFSLVQYTDLNGVIGGLNALSTAENSYSNVAAGLDRVYSELQSNSRPNPTRRIVIHITNSRFDNVQMAVLSANRVKSLFPPYNPCLYPVAILPDVDLDESRQIATDPSTVFGIEPTATNDIASRLWDFLQRCFCGQGGPGQHKQAQSLNK